MGSFITNIQVHTGEADAETLREKLIEAVRSFVLDGPLEEAPQRTEAHRTVAIGPAGPEPWLAVYDEATEDQDVEKLYRRWVEDLRAE